MIMVRPATVGEMEAFLKLKKIVDHEDWSPVRGRNHFVKGECEIF
jgi:hypothetical protein